MYGYRIRIEIPEGRVKEIMDEMDKAQETIHRCLRELSELGVLTIREKTASDN